jgi:hypothetical protein
LTPFDWSVSGTAPAAGVCPGFYLLTGQLALFRRTWVLIAARRCFTMFVVQTPAAGEALIQ